MSRAERFGSGVAAVHLTTATAGRADRRRTNRGGPAVANHVGVLARA